MIVSGRERNFPRLGLVDTYLAMLDDPALPGETRAYLQEKRADAETLIQLIDKRQDTISRITAVIARRQAEYFRHGIDYLVPMTRASIAEELDLDASTVSRAVNGKYIATPQGLKELRYFFSSGVKNDEGQDVSSRAVKARIREIIEDENPAKPYSDEKISQMLADEGIRIARKTVQKYRDSMNIPGTSLRRRH